MKPYYARSMRLALLLPLLLLAGCAAAGKALLAPPACIPLSETMKALDAGDARQGTLRVLAEGDVVASGRRMPVSLAIMAKLPDSLRIESLPPIGTPDLLLSVTGEDLRVYFPQKGQFYVGRASRHLERFIPLALGPREMTALLMGASPRIAAGCFTAEGADGERRRLEWAFADGSRRMTLWVEPGRTMPEKLAVYDAGEEKPAYTASFLETTASGRDTAGIPKRIVIRARKSDAMILLHYNDAAVEQREDTDAFTLAVPPGLTAIDLDQTGSDVNF